MAAQLFTRSVYFYLVSELSPEDEDRVSAATNVNPVGTRVVRRSISFTTPRQVYGPCASRLRHR